MGTAPRRAATSRSVRTIVSARASAAISPRITFSAYLSICARAWATCVRSGTSDVRDARTDSRARRTADPTTSVPTKKTTPPTTAVATKSLCSIDLLRRRTGRGQTASPVARQARVRDERRRAGA